MDIKLYYTEFCPHCILPITHIKENNLKLELIDATYDMEAKMEIMEIGGKIQVPMLSIDGKALYESLDILKWLENNM